MASRRPLPVPPYPGIIPYCVDIQEEDDTPPDETSPRLIGIEQRPASSFELPAQPYVADATNKFYQNWQKHEERKVWVPSDGQYLAQTSQKKIKDNSKPVYLSISHEKPKWPSRLEFLGSSWAFTLSLHSLWSLPVSIIQHGGAAFLLLYIFLSILIGGPLLLLEMFLGQYSGLCITQIFNHLCPLLAGLGLAVSIQAAIRLLLGVSSLMWSGKALFQLFSQELIRDGFFYRDILKKENSSLSSLGELVGELVLVLGCLCMAIFILSAASTRIVGKFSIVVVPISFMLLVILTIRTCLAPGAAQSILILLSPNWNVLSNPIIWLEATSQVIFSLQLGLGTVSTFASYNHYQHNIIHDCVIIIAAHLVWILLGVIFTFSLLGVAHTTLAINLENLASDPSLLSITGHGLWFSAVTLVETSLASISSGWLWAGLYFVLIFLAGITSVLGYLEVITSSLINEKLSIQKFKPALTFLVLVFIFLLDLVLATQGGIHIYHLVLTYIANWPTLLVSFLTVLLTVFCMGVEKMMKTLPVMSSITFPFWAVSQLSTIYFIILPVFVLASLVYNFSTLSSFHIVQPLSTFGLRLPHWGMPLGWSLAFLPIAPLVIWALVYSVLWNRETPRIEHLRKCIHPTERWTRNEQLFMRESETD